MADENDVGLILVGRLEFAPGDDDKYAEISRQSMIDTAGSPGCVYYRLIRDADRPQLFHLAEGWRDLAALELHFRRTHFQKAMLKLRELQFVLREVKAYTVSGVMDLPMACLLYTSPSPRDS